MGYSINLFKTGNKKIIEDFILSLSNKTIAKIVWLFDLLEKYGTELGMPNIKKIDRNLYELRVRKQQESIRFLFTVIKNKIIILHGFKKKKDKIPAKDLKTAKNLLTKYNI